MNNSKPSFECKDCGGSFPDAKEFVYHVDSCVPVKAKALLLADAVKLLRKWVKTNGETSAKVTLKEFQRLMALSHHTEEWLEGNKL